MPPTHEPLNLDECQRLLETFRTLKASAGPLPWTFEQSPDEVAFTSFCAHAPIATLLDALIARTRATEAERGAARQEWAWTTAERDRLAARVLELERMARTEAEDWAEQDTTIRDLCRPFLGAWVDGDSDGVPGISDVVDHLAARIVVLRAALRLVQRRWTFNNDQQPTHTWHDWADCQPAIAAALAAPGRGGE